MSTTYNPFRDMDRVFTQLARTAATEARTMPMDLYRDGDQFVVKVDLPGVNPDSIDIDVDDRTLSIRAERTQENVHTDEENHSWVSRERSYGSYARQLTLGQGLNLAEITAEYTDGVLTLTIPVAEEAKPRKVKVTQGSNKVAGEVESESEPVVQN
ncbi:Hsp20/alpha crystallin family protein [Propionimicrobium sp. PCR01-08-3]|uniref:Hsp20/alpha crystallin family protein n=1 Tax=Propionimicrobium sp. PCR01-08-3 TaxID=3052086 RepID=UPI00255CB724|nr:Hsp20/alpha crystallin family protein [Propionimicrobium sp. PCR01-08-3]WIY83712.1 Hsp20/alpha crystallin family protein [Propionimicrobium sp. PCR01-08-3]